MSSQKNSFNKQISTKKSTETGKQNLQESELSSSLKIKTILKSQSKEINEFLTCRKESVYPKCRSYISLFAQFLISILVVNLQNSCTIYYVSYLRKYNTHLTLSQFYLPGNFILVLGMISTMFAIKIASAIGYRITLIIAIIGTSFGLFFTAVQTNWILFLVGFAVAVLFQPFIILIPLSSNWRLFPYWKGKIAALQQVSVNFFTLIISNLAVNFLNPYNLSPTVLEKKDNNKYFAVDEMGLVVITMFKIFGIISLLIGTISAFLLYFPKRKSNGMNTEEENKKQKEQKQLSEEAVKYAFGTSQLWILFFITTFSVILKSWLDLYMKSIGYAFNMDDNFMQSTINIGTFLLSFGSIFWGFLADKFKIKTLIFWFTGPLCILSITLPQALANKYTYSIWINSITFFSSGTVSIMTAIPKMYGTLIGGQLVGIVLIGMQLGMICNFLFPLLFNAIALSYQSQAKVYAVFTTFAFILSFFYKEKVLIKEIQKENGLILPMIIRETKKEENQSLLESNSVITDHI